MPTLKVVYIKSKKLKDNKWKLKIAVSHKQETCYINTRFFIESESQFKNGMVQKRPDASIINVKLRNLLNNYQDALDSIDNVSSYSCRQLKDALVLKKNSSSSPTYRSACEAYIKEMESMGRTSYASMLLRSLSMMEEYTNGDIMLADITPYFISDFQAYLRKRKKKNGHGLLSESTVSMMLSHVKAVINRAISLMMVSYPVHPFAQTKITKSVPKQSDISLESFNLIRNSQPTSRKQIIAKDIFLLSFYTGGMNLVDILSTDFSKDYIEYIRAKTKNRTHNQQKVIIPKKRQAAEIIDKHISKNGKLDFGYKLGYKNFLRYIVRALNELREDLGINENVVFYSARKTFAQFASDLGVPDSVIDYCLGHSDKKKGVIGYYTKVRLKQADIAMERIFDYTENPARYKDFLELRESIMLMKE